MQCLVVQPSMECRNNGLPLQCLLSFVHIGVSWVACYSPSWNRLPCHYSRLISRSSIRYFTQVSQLAETDLNKWGTGCVAGNQDIATSWIEIIEIQSRTYVEGTVPRILHVPGVHFLHILLRDWLSHSHRFPDCSFRRRHTMRLVRSRDRYWYAPILSYPSIPKNPWFSGNWRSILDRFNFFLGDYPKPAEGREQTNVFTGEKFLGTAHNAK